MEAVVSSSEALDVVDRRELRALWAAAFGDRFTELDAAHAYGGIHVRLFSEGGLAAHASVVPRRIRVGDSSWFDAGYVEAVATHPERQNQGVGTSVMRVAQAELLARWELGVLSTGRSVFYRRLGWRSWRGPSYVITSTGERRTADEDDGLMALWRPVVDIDDSAAIACEDRSGDAW